MKKRLKTSAIMSLAALITASALTGCGGSDSTSTDSITNDTSITDDTAAAVADDSTVNNAYSEITEVKERGLKFTISNEYLNKGVQLEAYNENTNGYKSIMISYYSPTALGLFDEIFDMGDERTPEKDMEYTEKIWDTSRVLMEIAMIETDEYNKLIESGKTPDDFTYYSPSEEFGTNDGYTYVISIPDLDNGSLTEDEIKEYQDCKAYMQEVKENLSFIPVEVENTDTDLGSYMPNFTAKELNGETVTSEMFTNNKLTVVNIWGTFCGPCIDEMPDLAAWSEELPDGVEIIGLVGDIDGEEDKEHLELAQKIIEKANVKFKNLIANDDFKELLGGVIGFPTTFFVDSTGAIVGDPIVGADMESYKIFVEEYLSENK